MHNAEVREVRCAGLLASAHRNRPAGGDKTFGFRTERRKCSFRVVIRILWIEITIDIS